MSDEDKFNCLSNKELVDGSILFGDEFINIIFLEMRIYVRERGNKLYINTSLIKIISSQFKGNDKKERKNFIMLHIRSKWRSDAS